MQTAARVLAFFFTLAFWVSVVHGQTPGAVPGEYIVKMKGSGSASTLQGKIYGKARFKAKFSLKGAYHIDAGANAELIESLKNDPDVEYVEPNFILQSIEGLEPSGRVNAQAAQPRYDQTGASVKAVEAWEASSPADPSNRPIVAIIDTGLDRNHIVFQDSQALWVNQGEIPNNGIDDDKNGYVDDVNGWNFIDGNGDFNDDEDHGTHVAGIVLGATMDILGYNPEVSKIQLMPLKFLDSQGAGSTAAAVNAIYYAVNNGAKVINCSWGGASYSRALHDAVTHAYKRGVLVVSAAGNYSSNNDATPLFPANYNVPSNIAVAASSDSDRLASFSNYGRGSVTVAAPGVSVFSTIPGGFFASFSGTSMAAPLVAGAAALALREAPHISGFQLKSLITATVDPASQLTNAVSSGGRINLSSMVNTAKSMVASSSYQPDYSPVYQAESRAPASAEESSSSKGGCGLISAVGLSRGGGPGSGTGAMVILLLLVPLALALRLRWESQAPARNRRRFDRFAMESAIVIRCGDRELVGATKTISLGGLSFSADDVLEKGGRVQMKIYAPDGRTVIDVEGQIVWNEQNKAYGVQFGSIEEKVRRAINGWSSFLVKV